MAKKTYTSSTHDAISSACLSLLVVPRVCGCGIPADEWLPAMSISICKTTLDRLSYVIKTGKHKNH